MVEPDRPQMEIWRRVACWVSKATRAQAHNSARAPPPLLHTEICKTLLFSGNKVFVKLPQHYLIRIILVSTHFYTLYQLHTLGYVSSNN
jgi:hypothetical protein